MARAPTRGMCRVDARRASVDVASGMSRVGFDGVVVGGLMEERWTRMGRWAWAVDREGLGWVRMTMLRGLDLLVSSLRAASSDSSFLSAVMGIVDATFCAASISRCRVTLLMPTRMCFPTSGGGGGSSFMTESSSSSLAFLFLFLPLEGWMCALRCSPSGEMRLCA